jgi:hypothetical protein
MTTPSPAAPTIPGPTPSSSGSSEVVVDPTLLRVLPDAVVGVAMTPDLETAAEIAAEPAIAPFVEALALATAVGPPATDTVSDYVVVTVARLRRGIFGPAFFRGWRDTFDAAVCEQAGGVDGHAETTIAGHETFIGTCVGGVHTYHVHLPADDIVVSMQGLGDGRFGERVVETLRE